MNEPISTLQAALAWHDAGCAVIPIRADGTKAPLISWKRYQQERPERSTVENWFRGNPPGLAVICGSVSGGLEMLELEGRAIDEGVGANLPRIMEASGLTEVWNRIAQDGYSERTPSGGVHLLYRIEAGPIQGNQKLARRLATPAELSADPLDKVKVLVETRGEGGCTIVAPSHGTVHTSRKPWTALRGSHPGRIPVISREEREELLRVIRTQDAMPGPPAPPPPQRQPSTADVLSPGDDFEARTDWSQILEPAGWQLVHQAGRTRYWRRPGKTRGLSATTGHAADRDRLWVFSTGSVFETEQPITKFHAYAVLSHSGNHTQAANALRRAGFGSTPQQLAAGVVPAPDPPQRASAATGADPPTQGTSDAAQVTEALPAVAAWGPTEDGLARALVAYHGHELRFCPQRGKWLLWTGHRWMWDDAERHREHIRTLARELPSTGTWRRFRNLALSAGGVSGVARLARTDPAIIAPLSALDAWPYELNTPGGIVDLTTGQMRPPDPTRLHTRSTASAPDFDRRPEVLTRFIADTFGDDHDLAGYLQRLLGVSAIGTVLEQVLPFAHGSGANGKSTLLEAAMHSLGRGDGGYAMAASSEMLMVRKHAEHPAELAQLAGARLVVCAELDEGQRFAEARVKQLTGRDSINARFMRRDPFTFAPSHTLWLAGNHTPNARAGGPAFWRRVRLLPFTRVVPPERQDRRLGDRLAEEASAVLAWIVRGAADYHASGLAEPESVRSATAEYARDQDTVGQFVDERCELVSAPASPRVAISVLRGSYEQWCEEVGEEPVSAKRLTQQLRDRFAVTDTRGSKGRRFYVGITHRVLDGPADLRGVDEPTRGDR